LVYRFDLGFCDQDDFSRHLSIQERRDRNPSFCRLLREEPLRDQRIELCSLERVKLLLQLRQLDTKSMIEILDRHRLPVHLCQWNTYFIPRLRRGHDESEC
jgi:hypothetical protein